MDLKSGERVVLDWLGTRNDGSCAVGRLDQFINQYALHSEIKGADSDGQPSGPQYTGALGRLRLGDSRPVYIGKELDRLDEAEGFDLDQEEPIRYGAQADRALGRALAVLSRYPEEVASDLGIYHGGS